MRIFFLLLILLPLTTVSAQDSLNMKKDLTGNFQELQPTMTFGDTLQMAESTLYSVATGVLTL